MTRWKRTIALSQPARIVASCRAVLLMGRATVLPAPRRRGRERRTASAVVRARWPRDRLGLDDRQPVLVEPGAIDRLAVLHLARVHQDVRAPVEVLGAARGDTL